MLEFMKSMWTIPLIGHAGVIKGIIWYVTTYLLVYYILLPKLIFSILSISVNKAQPVIYFCNVNFCLLCKFIYATFVKPMFRNMNTRLEQFLAAENISQSQFADTIDVARASVSHILAGRNKPGWDFLNTLIEAAFSMSGNSAALKRSGWAGSCLTVVSLAALLYIFPVPFNSHSILRLG